MQVPNKKNKTMHTSQLSIFDLNLASDTNFETYTIWYFEHKKETKPIDLHLSC